jgi:Tfp pilus assembly protein PilN
VPHRLRDLLGWPSAAAALLALAISAPIYFLLAQRQAESAASLAYVRAENANLERKIVDVRDLPGKISDFLARKQVIAVLRKDSVVPTQLLNAITAGRPTGVSLDALNYEHLQATVAGCAASEAAVRTFMQNLSRSPRLEAVQRLAINRAPAPGAADCRWRFRLQAVARVEPGGTRE